MDEIPTFQEFQNYVSSALHRGWTGDITIQETYARDDERTIEVGGTSRDGKAFYAEVRITVLEED